MDTTYNQLSTNDIYNEKLFQDVLLGLSTPPRYLPEFEKYLRFVTVNFGLSGLLGYYTPREIIEGYNDPLIE